MSLWRYTAVEAGAAATARRTGELSADSAAEARAALRRLGLQVLDLRPHRSQKLTIPRRALLTDLRRAWQRHLRQRARPMRAELQDGLATLLESGVPLLEAVQTLSTSRDLPAARTMLLGLREQLRGGESLAHAMQQHERWFDPVEIAMVQAAQLAGTLPQTLRTLADRQERSSHLNQKIIGALAYPALVAVVGAAVAVFLSLNTLPKLVQILEDAKIDPPALTMRVMEFGQFVAGHWWLLVVAAFCLLIVIPVGGGLFRRRGLAIPRFVDRLRPRVLRRAAVAQAAQQLALLLRSGVTLVDALRILSLGTQPSSVQGAHPAELPGLKGCLAAAADRLERGDALSDALSDDRYFDAAFRRLLVVGDSSGDLDVLLDRLGRRYERQATRLVDRLAALLEPVVILLLAALVGTVVMAAILPLLRMQEMF